VTTRAGVTLLGVRHAASPAGGDTPGVRFQLAPGILVPARHDGYRRSLAASASGPVPGAGREHIRESCGPSSEAVLPELAEGARLRRFRVRPSSVTATSRSSRQARNRRADHLVGIEHRPTVASPRRVAFAAWTTELEHLAELSAARRTRTSRGPVSSAKSDRVSRRTSPAANTFSGHHDGRALDDEGRQEQAEARIN